MSASGFCLIQVVCTPHILAAPGRFSSYMKVAYDGGMLRWVISGMNILAESL